MNSAVEISTDEPYKSPNAGLRIASPKRIREGVTWTGGRSARWAHPSRIAVVAIAKTMYVARQPNGAIRAAAIGAPHTVPNPIPAPAIPSGGLRRRRNHPPTTATIGTYAHATPTPTPIP